MPEKPKFATCRHIKTNGRVCQSPAIRGQALCFFHGNLRHAHRPPKKIQALTSYWQEYAIESEGGGEEDDIFAVDRVYPDQNSIQFPPLEDAESVQLATSMLFQAIATGNVNFKRARLLLGALKIATSNLRVAASSARYTPETAALPTQIVRTPEGHILAAPDEPEQLPLPAAQTDQTLAAEPAPELPSEPPSAQPGPDDPFAAEADYPPCLETAANLPAIRDLDVTHLDRGFYPEPTQLCH